MSPAESQPFCSCLPGLHWTCSMLWWCILESNQIKKLSFKKMYLKCCMQNVSHVPKHDVIKWKHFPHYWPFERGIHQSSVNSPHKGQWRGALMFSLICTSINGWVNDHEAGDLRCHHAHYDFTVMRKGNSLAVPPGPPTIRVPPLLFWLLTYKFGK